MNKQGEYQQTMLRSLSKHALTAVAGLLMGGGGLAQAAPVIADSFSYADDTAVQVVWGANATQAAGLTFGKLVTSGGAAAYHDSADRQLNADLGGGPIWYSVLLKPTGGMDGGNWGGGGKTYGVGFSGNTGCAFDTRLSSPNGWSDYRSRAQGNNTMGPDLWPANETTYLLVAYLQKNGVGTWGGGSEAHSWIFTEAAFSNLVAVGVTWDNLWAKATTSIWTKPGDPWGFGGIQTDAYLSLMGWGGATAVVDELRIGMTVDDVLPLIPPLPKGTLMCVQ